MSAALFSKVVSALPGTLTADTIYFVRVGTGFDIYVTNHSGTIVAYPQNYKGVQVDIYGSPTTSGSFTWTKPSWARTVRVITVAPGGGGGSGRKGAAGTARSGGAGGAGGSINEVTFLAALLPATVPVVVRPGGAGGAAVTTNSTNGNPGATINGVTSSFGTSPLACAVFGAGAGLGGTNAVVAAGAAVANLFTGGLGGATSITAAATLPIVAPKGASGGGAGGSISTADVILSGSAGAGMPGVVYGYAGTSTNSGGASGGTVDGAGGTAGTDNSSGVDYGAPGGGGGAASKTSTGGGKGGDGAWPGGGGGGGGASTDDQGPSGAGGKGANGMVMVISMP